MTYRRDIDGLRAIAILSVIIFHVFPELLPGGFVGVDIFFVISGYLISYLIILKLDDNDFRLSDFVVRRIARIFPALIIVLSVILAFGWKFLSLDAYTMLGEQGAWGATFISNFLFLRGADYFDGLVENKPLLHLWSLSIEEQFYLAWPLALMALYRPGYRAVFLTIILILASFSLNIFFSARNLSYSFYLPVTRFWELLVGGLIACVTINLSYKDKLTYTRSKIKHGFKPTKFISDSPNNQIFIKIVKHVSSATGLIIVGWSVLFVSGRQFSGWQAIAPVVATAALIAAGPTALINRSLLSNRFLIYVGLISYPLYLWHWPILYIVKTIDVDGGQLTLSYKLLVIVLSILAACGTYELVEKPIRASLNKRKIVMIAAVMMSLIGALSFSIYLNGGYSFRKYIESNKFYADIGQTPFFRYLESHYYTCRSDAIRNSSTKHQGFLRCRQSKESESVDLVLLGDSHAEHLFPGIAEALPSLNVAYYIKGNAPFKQSKDFTEIFQEILKNPNTKTIIIASHWIGRLSTIPVGSSLYHELLMTASMLIDAGKQVYIINDTPRFPFSPTDCLGQKHLVTNPGQICSISAEQVKEKAEVYEWQIKKLIIQEPRIKLIEVKKHVCDSSYCSMLKDGNLLFRDPDHLTITGSKYIGALLVQDHPELLGVEPRY